MISAVARIARKIHPLVWLGLIFLAGWFYWFEYRPSRIVQKCNEILGGETTLEILQKAAAGNQEDLREPLIEAIRKKLFLRGNDAYERAYVECLRAHGVRE
mgnify:CR=1 FL=1